jgi:hypothetical protein
MSEIHLTPEDLLAGATMTFDIMLPPHLLPSPQAAGVPDSENRPTQSVVQIRPLTIGTFQLIMKAAKNDAGLIPLLIIKESLVQPTLSLEQTKRLPLGLVNFLVDQIRQVSGLTEKKSPSLN